jgi:hypothetical protein
MRTYAGCREVTRPTVSRLAYDSRMEILKVKLNETQTLIAYRGRGSDGGSGKPVETLIRRDEVSFKVGPNTEGSFIGCSPEAAVALLAMLDRQEKPSTP